MTLLDSLKRIDPSRHAIATPDGVLTYCDLTQGAGTLAPAVAGRRLVLNTPDLREAAQVLAAADGQADAVALMSPHHDPAMLAPLMDLVTADCIVSDREHALRDAGLSTPVAPDCATLQSALAPADSGAAPTTRWILTTSGTTGTPKLVEHTFSSLTRTTRSDTVKGHSQTWGMIYDYTRFAGLQVMLQSLLSGATLVVPPQDAPLGQQLEFLASQGCTHLSATPTMWRKILMTPLNTPLPLKQITLGGEIADETVLKSLAAAYPDARISHIFASTEAGVGFSVKDGKPGFPASYLTHSPAGIDLRIADGRLWVRNDEVGTDYLGGRGQLAQDGWVDTGDMIEEVDGRVLFKGRESGVINVGGNKVHPEEVERAILAHPGVSMVRVFAKANPIMGALVMAEIVPTDDAPATLKSDLSGYLRQRLEKYMVPASIRIKDGFETNAAGKIRRDG